MNWDIGTVLSLPPSEPVTRSFKEGLNHGKKLTSVQVSEILVKAKSGEYRLVDLATEYNVCYSTIYNILNKSGQVSELKRYKR